MKDDREFVTPLSDSFKTHVEEFGRLYMEMREVFVTLKQRFVQEARPEAKHLIVAVLLPTGATEIIHNTEQIASKIDYYINQYDDEFRLKANPNVRIINYMLV